MLISLFYIIPPPLLRNYFNSESLIDMAISLKPLPDRLR